MSTDGDGLLRALNDSQRYLDIVQKQELAKVKRNGWLRRLLATLPCITTADLSSIARQSLKQATLQQSSGQDAERGGRSSTITEKPDAYTGTS